MWIGDRVVIGCNELDGDLGGLCSAVCGQKKAAPISCAREFSYMAGYVTYEIVNRWECEISVEIFERLLGKKNRRSWLSGEVVLANRKLCQLSKHVC